MTMVRPPLAPLRVIGAMLLLGFLSCGGVPPLRVVEKAWPHSSSPEGKLAGDNPTIVIGRQGAVHILYEDMLADKVGRLWHAWRSPTTKEWMQEIVATRPAPYPNTRRHELFNIEAASAVAADGSLWAVWGARADGGGVDIWAYHKALEGSWAKEAVLGGLSFPATGAGLATCPDGSVVVLAAEANGVVHIAAKRGAGDWEDVEVSRHMHFPNLVCQAENVLLLVGVMSTESLVVGTLDPGGSWDWSEVPAAIGPGITGDVLSPPVVGVNGTLHVVLAREGGLLHVWGNKSDGWQSSDEVLRWVTTPQITLADPRLVLLDDGKIVLFFREKDKGLGVHGAVLGRFGTLRDLTKVFGPALDIDLARDAEGNVHLAIYSLPPRWGFARGQIAYLQVVGRMLDGL